MAVIASAAEWHIDLNSYSSVPFQQSAEHLTTIGFVVYNDGFDHDGLIKLFPAEILCARSLPLPAYR